MTQSALPGVLMVGTFTSGVGRNRSVCEDLADRLAGAGWLVIRTSTRRGRVLRILDMVWTVWKYRRSYHVAQVDVFSRLAFLWAEIVCFALRMIGKPYVLTLHGGELPLFGKRWPGRVRNLLRSAAAVTTPSRYLLEQMAPYREDLKLLPNPLDLAAYPYRLRSHPDSRLVWVRAFEEIYNPCLAARTVAALCEEFPDISLTMLGPDKGDGSLQELQRVVADLGVSDRIRLPGRVPRNEIPSWLGAADIFLNTTNVDNTPISVMEAMACGLCVVSTDAGGLPYLLNHNRDALLTPTGDLQSMAAAVRRVLTEPGLAERLSRTARASAEQFDWPVILPRWEQLLGAVVERTRQQTADIR